MELNLKGKRVLVTGASKGIGRACVELLSAEGCTVMTPSALHRPICLAMLRAVSGWSPVIMITRMPAV